MKNTGTPRSESHSDQHVGDLERGRITPLIRSAPCWFLDADIEGIFLPNRVTKVLLRSGIKRLRDVAAFSDDDITAIRGMGNSAIEQLVNSVSSAARWESDVGDMSDFPSLSQWLTFLLSQMDPREKEIVEQRLGSNGKIYTLEEISVRFHLTRERIRQIEGGVVKRLKKSIGMQIKDHIGVLMCDRADALFVDVMGAEDDWFSGFETNQLLLRSLIKKFGGLELYILNCDGRFLISRIDEQRLRKIIATCNELIQQAVEMEATETEVNVQIDSVCSYEGAPDLRELVRRGFVDKIHYSKNRRRDDERIVVSYGRSLESFAKAVLSDSEVPMHYQDIVFAIQRDYGRQAGGAQVQNALVSLDAKLFARGIYGFRAQLGLKESEESGIRAQVEEIVSSGGKNRQWHCHELIDMLKESRPDLAIVENGFILNMILERSDKLQYLGRHVWSRRQTSKRQGLSRIDQYQACEAILKDAGQPMTQTELKKALSESRGISSNFMIFPRGNLIRLRPGVWGLINRDIRLDENEIEVLMDVLADQLEYLQHGLHISEVPEFLDGLGCDLDEPYVILSFARRDTRFRVSRGQIIGLSNWSDSRRLTAAEAVREARERLSEESTPEQIRDLASELANRRLDLQKVILLLRN
ncbi:protein of unknown function [uncultured Woeseiaceae bacterium]|uniref:RNA polymerase sigma-70 domain-containing protein n=1 Tax=uncultured Woeseiaceae bacterium TaxID=1983305 RepID=A0A7D9D169_9GAMM|nr:protein of unknown function [uncultured Woeseiaceae bacterium]